MLSVRVHATSPTTTSAPSASHAGVSVLMTTENRRPAATQHQQPPAAAVRQGRRTVGAIQFARPRSAADGAAFVIHDRMFANGRRCRVRSLTCDRLVISSAV